MNDDRWLWILIGMIAARWSDFFNGWLTAQRAVSGTLGSLLAIGTIALGLWLHRRYRVRIRAAVAAWRRPEAVG